MQPKLSYPVYKSKYDSIFKILRDIDTQFMAKNPSDYDWFIKNERQSEYYKYLLVKHWGKKMDDTLWNAIKNHKAYVVSNDGMDFYHHLGTYVENYNLATLTLDDLSEEEGLSKTEKDAIERLKVITEKIKVQNVDVTLEAKKLNKIVNPLFQALFIKRSEARNATVVKTLDSCFAPSKADMLKLKMKSNNPKQQKIIDENVLGSAKTPWVRAEIKPLAQENQAKLDEIEATLKNATVSSTTASAFGKPMVEFDFGAKLYQVKDMTAQELLAKFKSSFNDKALLLDFWAVWCGPCLGDFPSSKKLHDAVEGEPVEFVYLCTSAGGSPEQWKAKIAQFELGGTHLYVEEAVEAELMKLFNGSGFPTYAFIDKNGEYRPGSIDRMEWTSKEQLVKLIQGE